MNFSAKMLRDNALSDKVIVVTGGGSGLGKAMTKYFLELGAKVAITSRDFEKLKTTAVELEKETGKTRGKAELSGVKCLPIQCDVRHYDQVEAMLAEVLKTFGRVDVLLNNAAGNFISPTERLSANAFSNSSTSDSSSCCSRQGVCRPSSARHSSSTSSFSPSSPSSSSSDTSIFTVNKSTMAGRPLARA